MSQRRDVVRNRARIVAAAEAVFRESGAAVPLDRVAERAGVGRGTLYRHFTDRAALIAAVYETRVDALERHVAGLPRGRLLEHLLVEISALQVGAPGMFPAVRAAHGTTPGIVEVEHRTSTLLAAALDEARADGRARPDVTVDDVRLVFAMVEGVLTGETPDRVPASVRRTLLLALRGLLHEAPDTPEDLPAPTLVLPAAD
jgi:AcrR family transcriptional regulator